VQILTVFAHPVPESFCSAVHARLVRELIAKGHEVRSVDLYALGFDPVLRADEWRRYMKQGANTEGIEEHLAQLRWAQGLIFVYPTWWYSLPAMLKGWLERVLVPYETFELRPGFNPILGRLGNIRLVGGISTYGSPWWWIRYVTRDPDRKVIMQGLKPLCAKSCRTFWLGLYHMDAASETQRQAFLNRVKALAASLD
jgi:NAD(P)H dehydrogenase (quinone)